MQNYARASVSEKGAHKSTVGAYRILTGLCAARIPVCIPPSYGHLRQQIDSLREIEFSCFHHLPSLLTEKLNPLDRKRTVRAVLVTTSERTISGIFSRGRSSS